MRGLLRTVERGEVVDAPTGGLDRTEVTVADYRDCIAAGKCTARGVDSSCNHGYTDRDDHPANCVTWHQAVAYCEWAGARLPKDYEWFSALTNGGTTKYPWGDSQPTCTTAIIDDDSGEGCGRDRTWPVCSRPAGNTRQGHCDLAGNVLEWTGSIAQENRPVVRGGDWESAAGWVVFRVDLSPTLQTSAIGFRCFTD